MASVSPPAPRPPAKTTKRRILRHSLFANFLVVSAILVLQLSGVLSWLRTVGAGSFMRPQSVILTDANGAEMRRVYLEQDRLELPDDAFSPFLKQAVIAIEDERFYSRSCIDLRAIIRAAVANFAEAESQGASTITQQLTGNLMLDRSDKSIARKTVELLLACRLEHAVSRDRILGLYLNHMAFGGALYGAEEAARTYFGVSAGDLSLAQSSVLAAMLQRPTYFSPYGIHLHTAISRGAAQAIREGAIGSAEQIPPADIDIGLIGTHFLTATGSVYVRGRTDLVLDAMQRNGFIGEARIRLAQEELKTMTFERHTAAIALPYFALEVQRQLKSGAVPTDTPCDTKAGGCIVETTLDPAYQSLAERIIQEHADAIRARFGAANIALVAADRATGRILAYVGNVRYSDNEPGSMIDMARIPRQPGSSFKPFVYAAAFAAGMNPTTFLLDAPLTLGGDQPRNYEGGYRDWTQISHALAASRNIPAIRTLLMVGGEEPVLETAARAGITTPLLTRDRNRKANPQFTFGYPLAIGSAETPLIEMVQGYLTLANAGVRVPLTAIQSVRAVDGRLLSPPSAGGEQAIEPQHARWLTSILSDTSIRPTPAWNEALTAPGIQTAIKTGTSDRCVQYDFASGTCTLLPGDVWTLGYSPEFVLGIWAGNADYSALSPGASGMTVTAPLWKEFIAGAHELKPEGQKWFPPALSEKKRRG
ncbi:MAG: transglycosylase domain-containing protein [Candidatus Peribacteraceae bacterium]|nr:transglycosylase domain-containing protein [Candidatus Peribacteraceae bacterium]MDD5742889.1 transglycosylase domain-containing protein [Candidatus Peribacteraceae bacterium]